MTGIRRLKRKKPCCGCSNFKNKLSGRIVYDDSEVFEVSFRGGKRVVLCKPCLKDFAKVAVYFVAYGG